MQLRRRARIMRSVWLVSSELPIKYGLEFGLNYKKFLSIYLLFYIGARGAFFFMAALTSRYILITTALEPAVTATKSTVKEHHHFPKAHLASIGISERKIVNQIANFALLEWPRNLKLRATAPDVYAPSLDAALSKEDRFHHSLPPEWWKMPYDEFLSERRKRMADVVRAAWLRLRGGLRDATIAPTAAELIAGGETEGVEFKATLRTNLHTMQPDDKMQVAALKTIAAFLNAGGGTLLVGVGDDGSLAGLMADNFQSEDKMGLHLINLIRDRIGDVFLPYLHPEFVEHEGGRILSIRCERGPKPAFVKDGSQQRFFVRGGNATTELSGPSIVDYTRHRFN